MSRGRPPSPVSRAIGHTMDAMVEAANAQRELRGMVLSGDALALAAYRDVHRAQAALRAANARLNLPSAA